MLHLPVRTAFFLLATVLLLTAVHEPALRANDLQEMIARGAQDPADAVKNLEVAEGLAATLSASEPMIKSLTNIAVDYRGRVWACEVVNYRHNRKKRPEGDRILILEDTTGDGVIDKSHVYYQGPDVNSAIGLGVFGNKVIVSCAPNVLVFTDEDGDDEPDSKEVLFTGIGGKQHDHSVHSFVFGPDGKFYFNFGNAGGQLKRPDGSFVVDKAGNEVRDVGQPYRQGMVFRCDEDGSNVETLAHNFRNNYELAVDAFGTIWQSDNDDDGNRGVRINYVMEYGNYGYKDELTGAHWSHRRLNRSNDIPKRHWHQNDPGSIPTLLETGAGSPTGLTIYEGDLLPKVFHGAMIHCDAGPSIVRAYPVEPDGAGYQARVVNILDGERDRWFRPADVAVAPDGSLFVSDWYDPGVGGHRQDDIERGRLFRVAPPGHQYEVAAIDFTDAKQAAAALVSCNEDTRYRAWHALEELGEEARLAVGALAGYPLNIEEPRFDASHVDLRHQARAIWWLANSRFDRPLTRTRFFLGPLDATEPDLQIVGMRIARQHGARRSFLIRKVLASPSPHVLRECAISLLDDEKSQAKVLAHNWAELAKLYDGSDRWYLEALGIGAHDNWDACLAAWLKLAGRQVLDTPAGREIVWRSRAAQTPTLLTGFMFDPDGRLSPEWPRWLRAMDFQADSPAKTAAIAAITAQAIEKLYPDDDAPPGEEEAAPLDHLLVELALRTEPLDFEKRPRLKTSLVRHLRRRRGSYEYFDRIVDFQLGEMYAELFHLALRAKNPGEAARPIATIVRVNEADRLAEEFAKIPPEVAVRLVEALGYFADARSFRVLTELAQDNGRDVAVRIAAARGLGRQYRGQQILLGMATEGELPEALEFTVANILLTSRHSAVRREAAEHLQLPESKDAEPLPPLVDLVARRGDVAAGREVFAKAGTCAKCHKVGETGIEVGPDLSEIGTKLSREALYVSILDPNAAVSHNYETYLVELEDGLTATGILVNETAEEIRLKNAEGVEQAFARDEVEEFAKLPTSLMPADLQRNLTATDLVNLVEYLTTLKKVDP
ncbi:MAG: dehydrogenase [Planctomycetota bacterium]|nr:MAG: dehydrogenase [Planctomycetota bacterium]REJ95908.1 MAG: dehydrogenase [Planctomycetota bacterium]